jgi:hypothetical protein
LLLGQFAGVPPGTVWIFLEKGPLMALAFIGVATLWLTVILVIKPILTAAGTGLENAVRAVFAKERTAENGTRGHFEKN